MMALFAFQQSEQARHEGALKHISNHHIELRRTIRREGDVQPCQTGLAGLPNWPGRLSALLRTLDGPYGQPPKKLARPVLLLLSARLAPQA
jgi:hypothetical protein